MKKLSLMSLILILSATHFVHAAAPMISVMPSTIIQGDPVMVTIDSDSSLTDLSFDGTHVPVFIYKGTPHALIAIDIHAKVGVHELKATFANGKSVTQSIIVNERKKIEAPLGIPAQLGGNTPAAAKALVTNLATANTTLASIRTGTHAFWTKSFVAPLASLTVTDPYGYNRETGEYTIAHKGTDFRAPTGTKVMAMNRGVVRVARTLGVYGKTIVVDHGFGLQTLYMHLSKIYVNEGELVQPGEVMGLSGMTGDALAPHLHLSVKIGGVSIDPVTFMAFFGIK